MATESSDEIDEEHDRAERRELVRLLVKRDMERNPEIYDELANE